MYLVVIGSNPASAFMIFTFPQKLKPYPLVISYVVIHVFENFKKETVFWL